MIPDADFHTLKSLSRAVRGGTLDALRLAERAYAMGSTACHLAMRCAMPDPETLNLSALERIAFTKALERTGNVVAAARLLGISRTNAYRKAKQYGVVTHKVTCPNCQTPIPASAPCPDQLLA
ncbi:MAG TPA: helix-turn-helix domain-containing protein [Bryobacteraceae bacterium]|jgi:transcriptional regulator of acetoin/glycerol metabolism